MLKVTTKGLGGIHYYSDSPLGLTTSMKQFNLTIMIAETKQGETEIKFGVARIMMEIILVSRVLPAVGSQNAIFPARVHTNWEEHCVQYLQFLRINAMKEAAQHL